MHSIISCDHRANSLFAPLPITLPLHFTCITCILNGWAVCVSFPFDVLWRLIQPVIARWVTVYTYALRKQLQFGGWWSRCSRGKGGIDYWPASLPMHTMKREFLFLLFWNHTGRLLRILNYWCFLVFFEKKNELVISFLLWNQGTAGR